MNTQARHISLPLLHLLNPRGETRRFAALFGLGLALGWLGLTRLSTPLWGAAVLTLALLLYPALRKWQADWRQAGTLFAILSVLLVAQSLHTVEHVAQWVQYHLLGWPLKASSGLISPLNAEVVHFIWNWLVLLVVSYLLRSGLRNSWMWLLFVWAAAHTAEHTYMFINYLQSGVVQGLPGFFGKGGWLATNAGSAAPLTFICQLAPALTTAPRLDVHFWWNVGEIVLLCCAANTEMRRWETRTSEHDQTTPGAPAVVD